MAIDDPFVERENSSGLADIPVADDQVVVEDAAETKRHHHRLSRAPEMQQPPDVFPQDEGLLGL